MIRRCKDFCGRLDFHGLRRQVLHGGGLGVGLVEFVVSAHLDLRRSLTRRWHSGGLLPCKIIDDIVGLIVLVACCIVLGVDLALVVRALLHEEVLEHCLQVGGCALHRAPLHLARLLKLDKCVLDVGALDDVQLRVPP